MKKSIHLKTFIIFLSIIILSSCGGRNSASNNDTFSATSSLSEEGPISSGERNIATRICYAYQSKSKNFRDSTYLGTHFLFSIKKTDCQNSVTTSQIDSIMNYDDNNQLAYLQTASATNNSTQFNKTVMTDTNGYLSQLCSKIITNAPISNTVTQADTKIQISFFRDTLDGFFLQYFQKQTDGSYKINSAEKFKTRSQIDYTTGKILGMDEYYSNQKICSSFDKNQFSTYEQTFTSH